MHFCSKPVPGSLFKLARDYMLSELSFTPAAVRKHLVTQGRKDMLEVNSIERNHQIIAERVMRAAIEELVTAGELKQVKRGLWAKTTEAPQAGVCS